MNAADRQRIRAAIDEARRELVTRAPYSYACGGCGRDRNHCNPNCETCKRRTRNRRKRELEKGIA